MKNLDRNAESKTQIIINLDVIFIFHLKKSLFSFFFSFEFKYKLFSVFFFQLNSQLMFTAKIKLRLDYKIISFTIFSDKVEKSLFKEENGVFVFIFIMRGWRH